MPSLFSKRLIVLLVGVIVMVVVIGLTLPERNEPTAPEQFIHDSIGLAQYAVTKPARSIAGFFETVHEIRTVYTENQRLKSNLRNQAILNARIRELEEENETLRMHMGFESSISDYDLRPAEVIMRAPDQWYRLIAINRGQKHGVEVNMAVITDEGFVGRIISTSPFTSRVELLTDPNRAAHISAIVQGEETIHGIIEEFDVDQELLYFREIPLDAPLEEGQSVISSGMGGVFPKGLYIGEIVEVIPDRYGLSQSAYVQPAANMYELDYVFVVERHEEGGTAD